MTEEDLMHSLQEINRAVIVIQGQAADIADRFEELKAEAHKLILEIDDKFDGKE